MMIDSHTHIGTGPGERSADDLVAMLDEYDLDCAVAFPGPSGLAGSPRHITAANEYLASAMATYPGRIVGFGTVNPWHAEEAWLELDQFRRLGLKGLKLHPPLQGFVVSDRPLLDPVLQRAAAQALPVVLHAGLRVAGLPHVLVSLEDVKELALAHSTVSFIVAHAAWGGRD